MFVNNHHKIISASILSANFAMLGEEVKNVLQAGADWIHIDVMDHHFVPNLTFGPLICQSLRNYGITAPFDVHLMTNPVDQLIIEFAKAGANCISIHPESTTDLFHSLDLIKQSNCKAGVAINAYTDINIIEKIYAHLDLILIMSVNPGFAGQKFMNGSFEKIEKIKSILKNLKHNIQLSIDGGVNSENIAALSKSGIDIFVAGSSIFNAKNYSAAINKLRELI